MHNIFIMVVSLLLIACSENKESLDDIFDNAKPLVQKKVVEKEKPTAINNDDNENLILKPDKKKIILSIDYD